MNITKKNRGQALVEMALVLPIFLFTLMAIYDFGITLHIWSSLNTQCVEASRAGAIRTNQLVGRGIFGSNTHAKLQTVTDAFWRLKSPFMSTANYTPAQPVVVGVGEVGVSTVTVSSSYNVSLITPLIGGLIGSAGGSGQLTLSATATAQKE